MEHRRALGREERLRLWGRMLIRLLALAVLLWGVRRVLPALVSLLLPFLLALLTAWLLNPVIAFLQKRCRLSRSAGALTAVLLTFALAGGGATALVYFLAREVTDLARSWQSVLDALAGALAQLDGRFDALRSTLPPELSGALDALTSRLLQWLGTAVPDFLSTLAEKAAGTAMGLPSFFVGLAAYLLGTYFLASGWPVYRRRGAEAMTPGGRRRLAALKTMTVTAFGGYLRAQLLLSFGVFLFLTAGFLLMRQPYALLLALLLAVLDFIPIVGAGTVMLPWAAFALLSGSFPAGLSLLALWGVIAAFRQLAEPRVLGGQTGLSPILSLFSVYTGMRLWGVPGMILAPVLVLIVRNLLASGAADGLVRDLKLLWQDAARLWDHS